MRNIYTLIMYFNLSLALVACASLDPQPKSGIFSGIYSSGMEKSLFRESLTNEDWWLLGQFSCTEYSINLKPSDGSQTPDVFLTVMGELSPPGRYGHTGSYTRELTVQETVSCAPVIN